MPRAKIAGAAVVVVVLLAWTVRSFVVGDGGRPTPTAPPVAEVAPVIADRPETVASAAQPVAAGDVSGIPVGYPATTAGATTAAVNWVASFPRVMRLNPLSLQNTLRDVLSDHGAATGTDEVMADYFELLDSLGPQFRERVWVESPLQASLVDHTDTTATVAGVG